MLYPAELQALPQPREVTVAQDFNLCPASQAGKKIVIWFIWFVSFVWLNETNQINKTNQIN
jgi:hypothetical protein